MFLSNAFHILQEQAFMTATGTSVEKMAAIQQQMGMTQAAVTQTMTEFKDIQHLRLVQSQVLALFEQKMTGLLNAMVAIRKHVQETLSHDTSGAMELADSHISQQNETLLALQNSYAAMASITPTSTGSKPTTQREISGYDQFNRAGVNFVRTYPTYFPDLFTHLFLLLLFFFKKIGLYLLSFLFFFLLQVAVAIRGNSICSGKKVGNKRPLPEYCQNNASLNNMGFTEEEWGGTTRSWEDEQRYRLITLFFGSESIRAQKHTISVFLRQTLDASNQPTFLPEHITFIISLLDATHEKLIELYKSGTFTPIRICK
jgi:hypothetical protein